jgi:hypothetical protein
MRVWLGLLLVATTASAEPVRALSVEGGKLAPNVVTSALAGFTVPAACATADKTVVAWVVYEHGKAVDAVVANGDVEACVAKALRGTKLETGAGRVGVTLVVKVEKPTPGPKVALLENKNQKVLDVIIDKNLAANLSKFKGIKGDTAEIGPGGGTGTTKGTGGGGTADGDFVKRDSGGATGGPHPKVQLADAQIDSDGWTAAEIDRVIRARAGIFRACYQRELHEHPNLSGKVVVHFRIVGDGHVENASISSTTLHSLPVETCIKNNVLRLQFPAKDSLANVNYPFVFSSGG